MWIKLLIATCVHLNQSKVKNNYPLNRITRHSPAHKPYIIKCIKCVSTNHTPSCRHTLLYNFYFLKIIFWDFFPLFDSDSGQTGKRKKGDDTQQRAAGRIQTRDAAKDSAYTGRTLYWFSQRPPCYIHFKVNESVTFKVVRSKFQ